jgi:flagellum-specific peptidoglycan hydrolase FlgJ
MLHKHSIQISIVIFIALSLALVLSVCSSGSIMASSRNDHNNQDKKSHDNNHSRADSRNDHNNQDKKSHDNNHSRADSRNDHNNQNAESKDNTGDRADVATTGNQNISCMGSFMSCRNDITNIVCSHVTYCFIGPTTPFMMANPTQQ